jgi:hypothetical protein
MYVCNKLNLIKGSDYDYNLVISYRGSYVLIEFDNYRFL